DAVRRDADQPGDAPRRRAGADAGCAPRGVGPRTPRRTPRSRPRVDAGLTPGSDPAVTCVLRRLSERVRTPTHSRDDERLRNWGLTPRRTSHSGSVSCG